MDLWTRLALFCFVMLNAALSASESFEAGTPIKWTADIWEYGTAEIRNVEKAQNLNVLFSKPVAFKAIGVTCKLSLNKRFRNQVRIGNIYTETVSITCDVKGVAVDPGDVSCWKAPNDLSSSIEAGGISFEGGKYYIRLTCVTK